MSPSIATDGFEIHRSVLSDEQVSELRSEADSIAREAGTTCVRHLRERSERFDALSVSDTVLSFLPAGLRPVRSILFDKTESENWPVMWHQDLTIAVAEEKPVPEYDPWSYKDGSPHVQPPVSLLEHMVTVRLHLDDTPAANGALRVIPRSHIDGRIGSNALTEYDKAASVICECSPGDALLMSPQYLRFARIVVSLLGLAFVSVEAVEGKLEHLTNIFSSSGALIPSGKPWVVVECGPKNWPTKYQGWLIEDDPKQVQLLEWEGTIQKLRKPSLNEKRPEMTETPDGHILWAALQKADYSVAWQVRRDDYGARSKKFLEDGLPNDKANEGVYDSVRQRFGLADHVVDSARYAYYAFHFGQKAHAEKFYSLALTGYNKYLKSYSVALHDPPENLHTFVADRIASRSMNGLIYSAHGGSPRGELLPQWERIAAIPYHQYRNEAQAMARHYRSLMDEDARWIAPAATEMDKLTAEQKASYWLHLLRDLDTRQWSDPGRCHVFGGLGSIMLSGEQKKPNPAEKLKELGMAAVPQLIAQLDDPRPTRCKGHWRSYWPEGHYLLRYGDCCQQIFESITGHDIYSGTDYPFRDGAGKECKKKAEKWWNEYQKSKSEPESP